MNLSSLLPTRGGKARKDRKTRKAGRSGKSGKGVFASVASPIRGLLRTATNVASSGLDTVYNVPATAVRGVKNTVRNSVKRLSSGVNNVVDRATAGVNSSISGVFSKKGRKNSRNNRNNNSFYGGYEAELVVPFKVEVPFIGDLPPPEGPVITPPQMDSSAMKGGYHRGGNQMLSASNAGYAMEGFHMNAVKAAMSAQQDMKHPVGIDGFKDAGSPIAAPMPTKGGFRRTHG